jgi:hypothetical protein
MKPLFAVMRRPIRKAEFRHRAFARKPVEKPEFPGTDSGPSDAVSRSSRAIDPLDGSGGTTLSSGPVRATFGRGT